MRPDDIYNAIGDTDDELLMEAEELKREADSAPAEKDKKTRRRIIISRFAAMAAGLAVMIGGVFAFNISRNTAPGTDQTAYTDKAVLLMEARTPVTAGTDLAGEEQEHADAAYEADPAKLSRRLAGSEGASLLMPDDGENHTYSPLNISLAMAMLSETTDGETRQQIYELLGVGSAEELRASVKELFRQAYYNDDRGKSMLADSLWLRADGTSYNEDVLRVLAEYYNASSFAGEMGSPEYDKMLQDWLNDNTGGLLEKEAGEMGFDMNTVIGLASTVYYHADWTDPLFEKATVPWTFRAPSGDMEVQMMQTGMTDFYYRGEHFGAVKMSLADGNYFWLFLPDEGYSVSDVTKDPAMTAILRQDVPEKERELASITLKFPRFDIASSSELKDVLMDMGIKDVFTSGKADFSPLLGDKSAVVSRVDHAARVAVDEYGVTAAAFTVVTADGGAIPPQKQVEFICDRPFVFAVANRSGLVFFEGVVNRP